MRNLQKKKHKIKEAEQVSKALIKIILVIVFLFINITNTTQRDAHAESSSTQPTEEVIYIKNLRTKMKVELVREVKTYINKIAPHSELTTEYLVDKCLEYNTDIIFVLSQALLESHFGTKGKAARTNSVWNVGTYDDGKILYTYNYANHSIEPYLKLLKEDYLIHITHTGDTIQKEVQELVEDKAYTNYYGARFASARGYENGMRKLMVKIDMETSISFYQDMLKLSNEEILTYFVPLNTNEIFYALN